MRSMAVGKRYFNSTSLAQPRRSPTEMNYNYSSRPFSALPMRVHSVSETRRLKLLPKALQGSRNGLIL